MRLLLIIWLSLLGIVSTADAVQRKVIEAGDSGSLLRALCDAYDLPSVEHEIVLAYDSLYVVGSGAIPGVERKIFPTGRCFFLGQLGGEIDRVKGRVRILGQASTVVGLRLVVEPKGHLTIEDLDIRGNPSEFYGEHLASPQILNQGTLELRRVSMTGADRAINAEENSLNPQPIDALGLNNQGQAILENVTLAGFNVFGLGSNELCIDGSLALVNGGDMTMVNVSISGNDVADELASCLVGGIDNTGHISIRNSLVANQGPDCRGDIPSGGHNLSDISGCFSRQGPGDRTDVAEEAGVVVTGGDRAVLHISRPLLLSDGGTDCPEVDQRGYPRLGETCYIGAVELFAPPGANPGTVSGLWYQRDHDGHYLQVSFVRAGEALLTWQTFDASGENVWIYGLGRPAGNELQLTLYRNRGPVLMDGVVSGAARAERLGEARFRMLTCRAAEFDFDAGPDLGSGTFDLSRLAFTEGLRCPDE